jgi:hypothetical protein
MLGCFNEHNVNELAAFWAVEREKLARNPEYWGELAVHEVDPYPLRKLPGELYYDLPEKLSYVELTIYFFQGDTVSRIAT